jgi:hypothetical protein
MVSGHEGFQVALPSSSYYRSTPGNPTGTLCCNFKGVRRVISPPDFFSADVLFKSRSPESGGRSIPVGVFVNEHSHVLGRGPPGSLRLRAPSPTSSRVQLRHGELRVRFVFLENSLLATLCREDPFLPEGRHRAREKIKLRVRALALATTLAQQDRSGVLQARDYRYHHDCGLVQLAA